MRELKARRAYFSEDEYDRGAHKICAKVSDCGYDRRNDWWSYAFEDEVYLKSEADKVIEEKDKEIAELKEKLMPCLNGDCILTCEVVEKYGKENAELKKKLEDAKATHYAEMVDAGMETRRLKRALWLARAERAKYRVEYWACRGGTLLEHYPFCVNGDSPFNRLYEMGCLYGDTNERLKEAKFKHLYASEWMLVWKNVERKCLKKAEEYK